MNIDLCDLDSFDIGSIREAHIDVMSHVGVRFRITLTGEEGVHTGRPRVRVRCLTCVDLGTKHGALWPHASLLHDGTTGPLFWIETHLKEVSHPKDGQPPRSSDAPSSGGLRDGLGNPISAAGMYYIQDTRTCVGNCALFWGKNRAGYVCALDEAGVYRGSEVSDRDTDVAWPVDYIESRAVRHVRFEGLLRDRKR